MNFSTRLKEAMEAKGVSGYKMANDLGVTQTTVYNWKSGQYTPESKHVTALAEYLDVSPSWLMYGESTLKVAEDGAIYQDAVFERMLERMTRIHKKATKAGDYKRLAALQSILEVLDHED